MSAGGENSALHPVWCLYFGPLETGDEAGGGGAGDRWGYWRRQYLLGGYIGGFLIVV